MRFSTFILALVTTTLPAAASESMTPSVALACRVLDDRPDWMDIMEHTQTRWGLSVEAQLALFAEEWQLEADKLPSRWRPEWTILDRNEPGIPAGYLDATWNRYVHESGNRGASTRSMHDVSDFMGWYFASSSEFVNILPGDASAFYIAWRRGPEYLRSGAWRSNTGLIYRSQTFAENAAQISEGLQTCSAAAELASATADSAGDQSLISRVGTAMRPWSWQYRRTAGGQRVRDLAD